MCPNLKKNALSIHSVKELQARNLLQLPAELLSNSLKVYPDLSLVGIIHKLKFFARGIITPHLSQQWFNLLRDPSILPLVERHPRVLIKLQQPYLQRSLVVKERWDVLQQHYLFALETFSTATLKDIFTSSGPILAELVVPKVSHLSVRLRYSCNSENEGELSLVLTDELNKKMVFALTFCVSSWLPNSREFFIGGLQGFKMAHDREYVVALTRAMFGLRPKSLLLFVLQTLASLWNVQEIHAVTNETRYLPRCKEKVMADYDQFWLECGGHLDRDNNYSLPVVFTPRSLDTITPRKRTMYCRRYEMLAEIEKNIRQNVSQLMRTCEL